MEEGEIQSFEGPNAGHSLTVETYNPAYEWPGESSFTLYDGVVDDGTTGNLGPSKVKMKSNQPTFRLVVLRSSILPSKQKIGAIDGYAEVQFGRDLAPAGSVTPRVRLKEMEVSKLHATAYWDGARREWGIVDMGSKHGTYLRSGPATSEVDSVGVRLSPPRVASIPKRLRHNDHLTIGTTTFVVHIHDSQIPCENCSPQANQEIPLFSAQPRSQASSSMKRTRDMAGLDETNAPYVSNEGRDPKMALSMLKRNLLTRHEALTHNSPVHSDPVSTSQYLDRAARRRAIMPTSHPDAPGVPIPHMSTISMTESRAPSGTELLSPAPPPVSQPPAPLSSANVGHRLLMKQGWLPGETLGLDSNEDRTALVEPLNVNATTHRAGLGVKKASFPNTSEAYGVSWKERERNKRYEQLRQGGVDHDK